MSTAAMFQSAVKTGWRVPLAVLAAATVLWGAGSVRAQGEAVPEIPDTPGETPPGPEGPASSPAVAPATGAAEGDEADEDEGHPATPGVAPRYVVWRIKAGTGAGALAPRIERKLRKELEIRLGGEMLSKAAQTGIILIRPELADCDANLPCALDVGEALNIRYVVGGEAEMTLTGARVTTWLIDLDHKAEIKRAVVDLAQPGPDAEAGLTRQIADALLAPAALVEKKPAVPPVTQESPSRVRPILGGLLLSASAVVAVLSLVGGLLGGGALAGAGGFAWLRQSYHTRAALTAMQGSFVGGAVLLAVGVVLLAAAVPIAALGALSLLGLP